MTDWLRDVPVYGNLNQIANAMNTATEADRDEFERCDSDHVLAGLACYLTENYVPEPLREHILKIVDTYCGKPVEQKG
jgi:hypothetical protein